MILGKNLIVSLDGVAIAGAKSCQLEMTRQFLQTCSPTESQVLDKVPTLYDWSLSCDGLIPASSVTVNLEDKLISGTKCFITFTDGSGNRRAGFVYVKSCRQSGSVGSLATYSVSFGSTGRLYKYTEYTTADFSGAGTCSISVNSSGDVTWSFASGTIKETAFSSISFRACYIIANGAWVVLSSTSESDVRGYINTGNTQSLNSKKYDAGNASKLIEFVSTNNFVFLTNNATKIYALS